MNPGRWQDWGNLFAGGWLFVCPWFYEFAGLPGAAWNAWIVGGLIGLLAVAAIVRFAPWQQGAIVVLGGWLAISPWIVGGAQVPGALWNFIAIGVLTLVLAAWSLALRQGERMST